MRTRSTIAVVLTLSVLAGACGGDGGPGEGDLSISLSPPASSPTTGATGATIAPSGSLPPTGPPGITGAVTNGAASLTLTGGLNVTVSLAELSSPAIWEPPPGGIALTWSGSGSQTLALGGPSFTSQQPTSGGRTLAFQVRTDEGLVDFSSSNGECSVTISPALPNDMGGIFFCRSLASADGALTVDAQGSFAATG